MLCNKCEDKNVLIECKCGCTEIIKSFNTNGRLMIYKFGHQNRRGGRYIDKDGYWRVKRPNHPFRDASGYVLEHRINYEEFYNCMLLPYTDIHHINGIRTDNRPDNLQALIHGKHTILTNTGHRHSKESILKMRIGKKGNIGWKSCIRDPITGKFVKR